MSIQTEMEDYPERSIEEICEGNARAWWYMTFLPTAFTIVFVAGILFILWRVSL